MTELATLVRADEWQPPEGWRSMLPSGVHCERCHALVPTLEAEANLTGEVFDADALDLLLSYHRDLTCRGAP